MQHIMASEATTDSTSEQGHTVQVAKHYNELQEAGLAERTKSRIFYVRNFNNWMKSMAIAEYLKKIRDDFRQSDSKDSITVLDLCAGKGGDLLKWKKGGIDRLVCADIAEISVEQSETRYKELLERSRNERHATKTYSAEFIAADCSKQRLKTRYKDSDMKFDLCSCQFSFHYCFESFDQAHMMMRNACECLKVGGYFIGTTPNAYELMKRLRKSEADKIQKKSESNKESQESEIGATSGESETKTGETSGESDAKPMETSGESETKPMETSGESETKPLETSGESETKPVETSGESETKPVEKSDESETKPVETSGESETKPMETSGESETKPMETSDETKTGETTMDPESTLPSFGNDVFSVTYKDKEQFKNPPMFGAEYDFQLEGVVNCPEFLVYFPVLEKLAADYGMKLVRKTSFADYFDLQKEEGRPLLGRMQALEPYPNDEDVELMGKSKDYEKVKIKVDELSEQAKADSESSSRRRGKPIKVGTLSQAEWEATTIYLLFAFQKVEDISPKFHDSEEINIPKAPTVKPDGKRSREDADEETSEDRASKVLKTEPIAETPSEEKKEEKELDQQKNTEKHSDDDANQDKEPIAETPSEEKKEEKELGEQKNIDKHSDDDDANQDKDKPTP